YKFFPNNKSSSACTIKSIIDNNRVIKKPKEILNYFHGKFPEIVGGLRLNFPKRRRQSSTEIFTHQCIVEHIRCKFKDNKASGPDGICGRIFSIAPEEIAPYLL
ncbi:Hypothetical protein FKW44_018988, partial [Caligus rogercresseyi]